MSKKQSNPPPIGKRPAPPPPPPKRMVNEDIFSKIGTDNIDENEVLGELETLADIKRCDISDLELYKAINKFMQLQIF